MNAAEQSGVKKTRKRDEYSSAYVAGAIRATFAGSRLHLIICIII